MERLLNQINSYCDCLDDITIGDVNELITLLSKALCWDNDDCGSLLSSERKEILKVEGCSKCAMPFKPKYYPYDEESFNFTLVTLREGIIIHSENIPYVYNEFENVFHIKLPECCKCCDTHNSCIPCKEEYKIYVSYVAGYKEFPDCVMPSICDLIKLIHEKRKCSCPTCTTCEDGQEGEGVSYVKGDYLSVKLGNETFHNLLVNTYSDLLGKMSLCDYEPMYYYGGYVTNDFKV